MLTQRNRFAASTYPAMFSRSSVSSSTIETLIGLLMLHFRSYLRNRTHEWTRINTNKSASCEYSDDGKRTTIWLLVARLPARLPVFISVHSCPFAVYALASGMSKLTVAPCPGLLLMAHLPPTAASLY